jgi:hypothetical protein
MSEELDAETMWADLPGYLREQRASWLRTLAESSVEPEEVGATHLLNGWLWLTVLAEAMLCRPPLPRFFPILGHAILRLTRSPKSVDGDFAWCEALAQDRFRIMLVRPKPNRRYGYGVETETVFEGDASQTADYTIPC